MTKQTWLIAAGCVLTVGSACRVQDQDSQSDSCVITRRECHVVYSPTYDYDRYCSTDDYPCDPPSSSPKTPSSNSAHADAGTHTTAGAASSAAATSAQAHPEGQSGAAPLPDTRRYSAFDEACTRDSQCGSGKCISGECFYGCQSDAQCGSGDRCAVETGTRICEPDPNPPVECTRTAQCQTGFECLNGSCRQTCSTTEECTNVVDRCASGVCQPDRRPLGQCVLDQECGPGLVCLDGACVSACAEAAGDGGVCLDSPTAPGVTATVKPSSAEPRAVVAAPASPPDAGPTTTLAAPAEPPEAAPAGLAADAGPVTPVIR
jgi:hypothetical protein